MEVRYRSASGQFEVSFDVKAQTELFEALADFQEVFESPEFYVIAGKKVPYFDVSFRVRTVEDNKYYEKVYTGPDKELWGYKLPFGVNKKGGGLFPKYRIDEEDKANYEEGGGGWRKWKGSNAQKAPATGKQTSRKKDESVDEVPF